MPSLRPLVEGWVREWWAREGRGHAADVVRGWPLVLDRGIGTVPLTCLPVMVGDDGTGGTAGIVPAPGSGDAASGYFLAADGTWAAPDPGGGGAMSQIGRQVVAGSVAASITFSSIPDTYNHLLLVVSGRGDAALSLVQLAVRCNGDSTAAHYVWSQAPFGNGAFIATGYNDSADAMIVGAIAGASATASFPASTTVTFPDYAETAFFKTAGGFGSGGVSTTHAENVAASGIWKATTAISSLLVYPWSGNFVIGTSATLYGIS